jgi:GT2 family glycosyltransferase
MVPPLPLVSVIVVTINHLDLLRNCLGSLFRQDYAPIEIIVVDNGSAEDVQGMLAAEFPEVRVLRLTRNQGFAGGNNRGIEISNGKYIALINNDAVAEPQWISAMVAVAEANPSVAAVASIIIDGNQPDVLDSCGVGIGLDGMSRQAMRGAPVPKLSQPQDVLLFSGCACLLRKDVLDEVGLFDEDFFAYCEDTDLGLRIYRAGRKIVAAPNAYVKHFYSMTAGKFSLKKIYWVERNHVWVAIKNFPWPLLAAIPVVTVWRHLAQAHSILNRSSELNQFTKNNHWPSLALTYIKAYIDMVIKLPVMMAKRRAIHNKLCLKNSDMLRLIWKFRMPLKEIIGVIKRPAATGRGMIKP